MFENRKDAGEKLASALDKYRDKNVLVLAIPRGGVEVGYEVAEYLGAEFSIIVTRKLPFADNPESGFGAIAEDGSAFIFEFAKNLYSRETLQRILYEQREEVERRIAVLRKGKPLPEIKDRTVILVDDGIAMGSTMRASIQLCRKKKAEKIVVAVPVTGKDTKREIGRLADEVVILETPLFFQAVAQVYSNWYDVPDEEVIEILRKSGKRDAKGRGI